MRTLIRSLAFVLALAAAAWGATPGGARPPVSYVLDAPNGSAQWSTVVQRMKEGDALNLYVTPLRQHLGDSVYATEIQVHLGPVALGFARMDPRVINKDIGNPDKLPPIWELRQIVRGNASAIEDPRTMALGAAAVSLEDGSPAVVQARLQRGILQVWYRPSPRAEAVALGRYSVGTGGLAVRTRVIGYRARFTLP